jgi:hypothetical protein
VSAPKGWERRPRPYRIDVVYDKTGWPSADSYPGKHTYSFVYRESRDAAVERLTGEEWVAQLSVRDVLEGSKLDKGGATL